jgi:hypothetical protein
MYAVQNLRTWSTKFSTKFSNLTSAACRWTLYVLNLVLVRVLLNFSRTPTAVVY